MSSLRYDKILQIPLGNNDKIKYSILRGNEKIVFVKAGAPRDIDEDKEETQVAEYIDKYLIMAHRIHARIGATVIHASNCKTIGNAPLDADKFLIDKIISELKLDNCELYFVGTSDGGYHNLKLSQQFPQTVKFLGINSSYNTVEDFIDRISSLSHVKKTLVYGSRDVDFDCIVPRLKELEGDNLELIILDGVDHDFTDRVDDFIALVDLI